MEEDIDRLEYTKEVRRITFYGLIVNILLTVFKIIIGFIGKSSSVLADGVHSLSDCSTDIAVIVGVKFWNKAPDSDHPYGHRRIEAMISVFIAIALGLVGIFLIYDSIVKIHTRNYIIPEWSAFIIAFVSIITKEILYRWTVKKSEILKCNALRANAWHHRSDAVSSIPVAVAISFCKYDARFAVLDPVASVAVSFFILKAAYDISMPALLELSDSGTDENNINTIKELVSSIEGVESIHQIRTRYQGNGIFVDLHVQVNPDLTVREGHSIAGRVKHMLLEKGPQVHDVLVHVEPNE